MTVHTFCSRTCDRVGPPVLGYFDAVHSLTVVEVKSNISLLTNINYTEDLNNDLIHSSAYLQKRIRTTFEKPLLKIFHEKGSDF